MSTVAADWSTLSARLENALHLQAAPVFMAFGRAGAPEYDAPMSEPAADGRAGRAPASCVFWVQAAEREAFTTVAADHGNCSVGLFTHGFASLDEVAGNDDVAALLASGWVTESVIPQIPSVTSRPEAITYGRLDAVPDGVSPDVVMLRVNGRQMMVLSDSIPGLSIQGKPQCHIVAIAKEQSVPAASVGCALSRSRTGMRPDEMTCALPAAGLEDTVASIEQTAATDSVVARYAAEDARRFS
ncbi:MAG TPA: DUF169 domain-containing protein [Acidimicrobiales bacterium]|nr:DUF169 domain-containing protein [Acidimicrobiales bacterium]